MNRDFPAFLMFLSLFVSGMTSTQTFAVTNNDSSGKSENIDLSDSSYPLDIESLVAIALESNPSIMQADAAVAKAAAIQCQVGLKPNPVVGYFGQEIGNNGAAGQQGIYVARSFVRGDKLSLNREVVARDVERLRWEADAQRRRVETDVRVSFFRALTAQLKLQTARKFLADATQAVEIAEQRLEAAEGTRPDLMQSQILVDQIDLSVRESEFEWQAAWRELSATVGDLSLEPSILAGELVEAKPLDREKLYETIESTSPLVHAAEAQINRAKSNLNRQHRQVIPNVNAQFGVGHDDSTGDTIANIQLGIPLPINNRNQGNIRAAQANYHSAVRNLERLRLQLRRDLADPIRRYETATIRVNKYQSSIIPKAKESLELIQKARAAGEVEFLRVLSARQNYFELSQALVDARGELSQADCLLNGLLLSDSLKTGINYGGDDGLRGQALNGE